MADKNNNEDHNNNNHEEKKEKTAAEMRKVRGFFSLVFAWIWLWDRSSLAE